MGGIGETGRRKGEMRSEGRRRGGKRKKERGIRKGIGIDDSIVYASIDHCEKDC